MVAGLKNHEVRVVHEVNQSVLIGDAPRPRALRSVLQLFGLADPGEWFAQACVDERVDAFKDLPVGRLPVLVVFPGRLVPDQTHSGFFVRAIEAVDLDLSTAGTFIGIEQAAGVGR